MKEYQVPEILLESGVKARECVLKEDYLKVVEEKERLVKVIESKNKTNHNLIKELKEKDGENKRLKDKILCLELGLNEEKEDTYTLSYSYYCENDKMIKQYKQSGLLKEEYEEMYGMDSDNWLSHSLVKDRKEVK